MTVPKINSAHGSDTRNIINRAIDLINFHGKTIQDLVAEGQLTEEQYAHLITVINGLLKSGDVDKFDLSANLRAELASKRPNNIPINLNNLGSDVLSVINDSNTSFNLLSVPRKNSVSPDKTTFINVSSNIFNTNDVVDDYGVSDDGEVVERASYSLSGYIAIDPTTLYTFYNYEPNSGGAGRVAYYDENHDFIGFTLIHEHLGQLTEVSPENAHFLRLQLHTNRKHVAQINVGPEVLPYEEFYQEINTELLPSVINALDGIMASENETWEV